MNETDVDDDGHVTLQISIGLVVFVLLFCLGLQMSNEVEQFYLLNGG